jgi:tetratricopeptide (TPR) repeat protein
MLLQPDSRLYIIPSSGGAPRLMNCNMKEMNSWHSWSPNGRWLVFSSKNKGLYTQLYLTHIDENGMDSPPILLENLTFEKRAANIPEFYPFNAEKFKIIKDDFSHTAEYYNRGAFDKITSKYYKHAFNDLKKAIELDSNNLETYVNRIMLNNILRQANSIEDLADKKKAMQLINDSLSSNPANENYLSLKISLLSNMGNKVEALKLANLAINNYPSSYKLHDLLGSIYRQENQFEKAIACYNKLLTIDADKKLQLNNLIAEAYMNMNQHEKALQIINRLISTYPNNNDLIFTRAQIMLNNKNLNFATRDIQNLIKLDTANIKYNQFLAQCYFINGNKQLYSYQKNKVLNHLNDIYIKNNEDIEVVFEMANIYMSLKNMVNAGNMYDLILQHFPNNYEALKQKAMIKLNMQQWHDAILIYDQLENTYPLEEGFCNNMAIAYIQVGNYSKALEYFDKTIKLNPNNKDAIFNRSKLIQETTRH